MPAAAAPAALFAAPISSVLRPVTHYDSADPPRVRGPTSPVTHATSMRRPDGDVTSIESLLSALRPGYTLPQPFYRSRAVFDTEIEHIFLRHWLLAGHASQLPPAGGYFRFDFGRESFVVTRAEDGRIRAFFNVCRHRGARLCPEERGQARALVCPYHAWAFGLDGRLNAARAMPDDFAREEFGLIACRVEVVQGLIFINPLGMASFDGIRGAASPILQHHMLEETRVAASTTWQVRANWKLLVENFEECYHCGANHPEYTAVAAHARPESTGSPQQLQSYRDYVAEWERRTAGLGHPVGMVEPSDEQPLYCGRVPLVAGARSQSEGGELVAPLLGRAERSDGGVTSLGLYPTSYVIVPCDYAVLVQFLPLSIEETTVRLTWLVRSDAQAEVDYSLERLTWMWRVTTEQDNRLVELNQLGVESTGYSPGRYSLMEDQCERFVEWYVRQLRSAARCHPVETR
jgi:phenylpropionate dioxygenase-like ring-hydroxylating dioxygenase large terminal subunit